MVLVLADKALMMLRKVNFDGLKQKQNKNYFSYRTADNGIDVYTSWNVRDFSTTGFLIILLKLNFVGASSIKSLSKIT